MYVEIKDYSNDSMLKDTHQQNRHYTELYNIFLFRIDCRFKYNYKRLKCSWLADETTITHIKNWGN